MRYSIAFAALAAAARAQDVVTATTSVSAFSIETTIPDNPPDALDLDGILAIPDPTYTEVLGLASQDIAYATATAISSAAADVTDDPLTVFPAATDVAMNAAGESDSSAETSSEAATATAVEKRDVYKRTACAPQATIVDTYGIDVSSYANFKADAKVASVANAAPTPAGYYQNSKNLKGAQSAYAYLGYTQLKTYDVQSCADKCTKKTGCLGFNIYFERDPVVEPGFNGQCEQPAAFANIKCSFWGSVLQDVTATNTGQWQSKFQVGIAGSNSYSSSSTGEPIDGTTFVSLNNAVMNAPLRDCVGTWTYMGYKPYTSGPYEPRLCKAACDAQNDYNRANPPTNGDSPAICSGFGSYLLTMTNSTGAYPQGQICSLYTAGWGKQYAVNTVSYDDRIGAKYTYSSSYFYNVTASQPVCPDNSVCSKPYTCYDSSIQTCPNSGAYCFKGADGVGRWSKDAHCGPKCSSSADCSSSQFCADTCCGRSCLNKLTCTNSVAPSRMFRREPIMKKVQQKKRDTACVSTNIAACPDEE